MLPLFNQVVIVGPGLIGGSFGMAARVGRLAGCVVGVGHRAASLEEAQRLGALDAFTLDGAEAVAQADLVLLATGLGTLCSQVSDLLPRMKPGAILTDVGSVKGCVCRAAEEAARAAPFNKLPSTALRADRAGGGALFVGGHPLAGSEQRGIAAAKADLFRGALCILTPSPATDPHGEALRRVRALWEAVGCAVREMPAEQHDRLLAQVSHLPHAAASCLLNCVSDEALAVAARGFMDTTRIASGDASLWRDICMANREALAPTLRAMAEELARFAQALETSDAQTVLNRLLRAKERRDRRNG